jgi:WhiB family redox-sensing transcriptional regulator
MQPDAAWMAIGLCKDMDPDVFFPNSGSGVIVAQKICQRCPVAEPCLDYALEQRIEFGVWGGVSERGRRRILQARAGTPVTAAADAAGPDGTAADAAAADAAAPVPLAAVPAR